MIWFPGKRIMVVGLARSGMAALSILHRKGAFLYAYDDKKADQLTAEFNQLATLNIPFWSGQDADLSVLNLDMVVVSPGVPLDIPVLQQAKRLQIPIIGELELAYQLKSEPVQIYAITGTNGKTTTTALLHHILKTGHQFARVGGNIGIALCSLVDDMPAGILVVEVSSFQLETIQEFRPYICGVLNITPDHLDRHKTMEEYTRIKARIFEHQTKDDYVILNHEDPLVSRFEGLSHSQVVFFSAERILPEGIFVKDGSILVHWRGMEVPIARLQDIKLRGKHNLENILCAVAMAWMSGIEPTVIAEGLYSFQGVRHRLEEVALDNGVLYVNDSKGTNPDSTIKALEAFEQPVILIAGGRAKGGSYDDVARLINARVKDLVLVGEARELIKRAVMEYGFKNIYEVEDFETAVKTAAELAQPGDVVLLSPACASWDMFPSYEHRGDLFCELVNKIIMRGK